MTGKTDTGPYRPCHTSKDDDPPVYGIDGTGTGLGYHAWYLFPENTFDSMEMATKVARMMNLAFIEGQRNRSRQIKELLG